MLGLEDEDYDRVYSTLLRTLSDPRERLRLAEEMGVDLVRTLRFSGYWVDNRRDALIFIQELANTDPRRLIEELERYRRKLEEELALRTRQP